MKLCQCCLNEETDEALTCAACGQASWLHNVETAQFSGAGVERVVGQAVTNVAERRAAQKGRRG